MWFSHGDRAVSFTAKESLVHVTCAVSVSERVRYQVFRVSFIEVSLLVNSPGRVTYIPPSYGFKTHHGLMPRSSRSCPDQLKVDKIP